MSGKPAWARLPWCGPTPALHQPRPGARPHERARVRPRGRWNPQRELASARGEKLDTFYSEAMRALLARGRSCSIATHDEAMLNYAHEFAQQRELDPQFFEFEMLHGATPDRLKQMLDRGYRVRDYLPYGREWYLYVCHRLAEYPPNIYRALADAVGDNCLPISHRP